METSPEMLAVARNIVECAVHWSPQTDRDLQSGKNDNTPEMKIALAAIKEITDRAARLAGWAHMVPPDGGSPTDEECDLAIGIAQSLQNGEHLRGPSLATGAAV